jgi:hypothetical protein
VSKALRRIGKAFVPAANAFTFSLFETIDLAALKQVVEASVKIRLETLPPVRICTQISFDQLLACRFLRSS